MLQLLNEIEALIPGGYNARGETIAINDKENKSATWQGHDEECMALVALATSCSR